jgi:anti-sigma-K factor RskA
MSPTWNPQLSDRENHARFVELCALYSTASLETHELADLDAHLASCQECRGLLADYRALVRNCIPLMAADESVEPVSGFDHELAQAKDHLLSELERDPALSRTKTAACETTAWSVAWFSRAQGALRYAAVVILAIGIGLGGFVAGVRRSAQPISTELATDQPGSRLQMQLSQIGQDRDSSRALSEQRERELRKASAEIDRQLNEISKLRELLAQADSEKSQDASAIASLRGENVSLKADHDGIAQRLQEAQNKLGRLKDQSDQLENERVAFQVESGSKDKRVEELTTQISDQQRLLAADRDIRELMGARDLLISDVLDIDTKGHSKKPFGRIFYTKNKYLVFYAFDLDRQSGIRDANAFQAWGATATSKGNEHPVSLGVFYMDNETARRWKVELKNPKILEQINSVFVTVEPEGGSNRPSGKQLLFTYLRGEANHP